MHDYIKPNLTIYIITFMKSQTLSLTFKVIMLRKKPYITNIVDGVDLAILALKVAPYG